MQFVNETGIGTLVQVTGVSVITSGNAQILGVGCYCSTSGALQLFAGTTASASISPVIRFAVGATTPNASFQRVPMMVSGSGFSVSVAANTDPNFTIYWLPMGNF